jgi:catechol 2,3-dioxygenase
VPLPAVADDPPFDVTRCSHVRLAVTDLDLSLRFYEQVVGLVPTTVEDEVAYLRGVEEVCHHSLVLERGETAGCVSIGMRVRRPADLDSATRFLASRGLAHRTVELAHQGPTVRFTDISGTVVELCAGMETVGRYATTADQLRGGAPTGIDHYQLHVVDPNAAAAFYGELGFRMSEYITMNGTPREELLGVFLARKGNANDLVMVQNAGPRLHHFSFVVHEASTALLRVCDLTDALGVPEAVEWGPSRHGLGGERFLYLRDPDGHRVELLSHPYRFIDEEEVALGWARTDPRVAMLFGPRAPESWFEEASDFVGSAVRTPPPASGVTA